MALPPPGGCKSTGWGGAITHMLAVCVFTLLACVLTKSCVFVCVREGRGGGVAGEAGALVGMWDEAISVKMHVE